MPRPTLRHALFAVGAVLFAGGLALSLLAPGDAGALSAQSVTEDSPAAAAAAPLLALAIVSGAGALVLALVLPRQGPARR